jgi:hypothetical protein
LALLQLGTEEVEDPNLFPAVELENGTEVELFDVGVFEQVWDYLLRLLLLLLSLLIKTTTTEVELGAPCATAEELTEDVVKVASPKSLLKLEASALLLLLPLALFMLADTLRTLLVINPSLFSVTEHVIRICDFLELLLSTFRVVRVLVRVVFDRLFLEGLFDVCFCSVSL